MQSKNDNLLYVANYNKFETKKYVIFGIVVFLLMVIIQCVVFNPVESRVRSKSDSNRNKIYTVKNQYGETIQVVAGHVESNAVLRGTGSSNGISKSDMKIFCAVITIMCQCACIGLIILSIYSTSISKNACIKLYDTYIEGMALSNKGLLASLGKKSFRMSYNQILHVQNHYSDLTIMTLNENIICRYLSNSETVSQQIKQRIPK